MKREGGREKQPINNMWICSLCCVVRCFVFAIECIMNLRCENFLFPLFMVFYCDVCLLCRLTECMRWKRDRHKWRCSDRQTEIFYALFAVTLFCLCAVNHRFSIELCANSTACGTVQCSVHGQLIKLAVVRGWKIATQCTYTAVSIVWLFKCESNKHFDRWQLNRQWKQMQYATARSNVGATQ